MIQLQKQGSNDYHREFEILFDKYSSKAFGFIIKNADTPEEAKEYLIKVFLRIWNDIPKYEEFTEDRFISILLFVCKPILRRSSIVVDNNEKHFTSSQ